MNKNHPIADSEWEFNDDGNRGSLVFGHGLESVSIESHGASDWETADFQLKTRNDGGILSYKGEAEGHDGDYKMLLNLKYFHSKDMIVGKVSIEQRGVPVQYARYATKEEFHFIAERQCCSD